MSRFRVDFRDAAASDILEQDDWYRERGNAELATRWSDAVTATVLWVLDNPLLSPLCTFRNPLLAGTRRVGIQQFPRHLLFYRVREDTVVILRVLHGARDIESLFETATEL